MTTKHLKIRLILCLTAVRILCSGQTGLNNICLTPKEYRFFDAAVIDRQTLKQDTSLLKSAIRELQTKNQSYERSMAKNDSINSLMYQKEAVYKHDIDLLQDDVDKYKTKTVRNRRIAIIGFGTVTFEALIIAAFIYLR